MSKAVFITSAPIKNEVGDFDLYDSFDLVSRGEANAFLIKDAQVFIENNFDPSMLYSIDTIFTAASGQTLDTARLIKEIYSLNDVTISPTPLLNGVLFSMTQLISKEVFLSQNIKQALDYTRLKFVEGLFDNKLIESREDVKMRVQKVIALVKNSNALCISHSFFMKIIEIYLKDKEIFEERDKFINLFQPNKKPYGCLKGFTLEGEVS